MSQQILKPDLDKLRNKFSLLRGLDAPGLAAMLDAATDNGEFARLQWLFHRVVKRWPILRALRERRVSALLRKEWDIVVATELPPGATEDQAKAQVKTLREAYDSIDNLSAAIRFLSSAEFTGFAHLQKHRDSAGQIIHLEPLDQWCWVRDGYRGEWLWNPTAEGFAAVTLRQRADAKIDPSEFLIREVENPVYEAALPLYLTYTLARRDWAAYSEVFGIPKPTIVGPDGAMTPEQEAKMLETAEAIGNGSTAVLPFGSTVNYPTEQRQEAPFKALIQKCEEEVCMAVTSGQLSMLNGPTGLGSSTSKTHQDAFNELAEAEAMEISEIFQRQLDREILSKAFPRQPVLAYFKLAGKDETDVTEATTQIQALAAAGWSVEPDQVAEVTGWRVTEKPVSTPSYSFGGGTQPDQPDQPDHPDEQPDQGGQNEDQ